MGYRVAGRRVGLALIMLVLVAVHPGSATPMPWAAADDWVAPLPEPLTITRSFDPPDQPYGAGHRGVDLAGNPGQEVHVAGSGTVVYAGPLAGRGVVSVQHADGLRTTYEPVLATVSAGVSVALGQVIGTLSTGHPGCPVTACLHWGLKRGEHYLNPLLLLTHGPVRLLPRYGADQPTPADPPSPAHQVTVGSLLLGVGLLPVRRGGRRFRPADELVGTRFSAVRR